LHTWSRSGAILIAAAFAAFGLVGIFLAPTVVELNLRLANRFPESFRKVLFWAISDPQRYLLKLRSGGAAFVLMGALLFLVLFLLH
jgi:hypothetical protein